MDFADIRSLLSKCIQQSSVLTAGAHGCPVPAVIQPRIIGTAADQDMLLWNHAFQILPPALKQKIIGLSVNDPKALLLQTVKELLSKRYKRRCGPGRIALLPAGGNSGSLRHTGNSPVLSARPQPSDQTGIRRQKIADPYPRQRVHFRKGFQDHQPAAASQILFHGSGQLILRKIQEAFIHHKNNSLPFRLFHDLQQQLCGNEPAGWIIGIAQKRHISAFEKLKLRKVCFFKVKLLLRLQEKTQKLSVGCPNRLFIFQKGRFFFT